jgi:hypothetical protein
MRSERGLTNRPLSKGFSVAVLVHAGREPWRLPAWIAKGCKPPLAPRYAIAYQSSAFSAMSPISLPLPTPQVPPISGAHIGF